MHEATKPDEQEPPSEPTEPAPEQGMAAPIPEVPRPFPPETAANEKDIRNLYGLYWLSKS